MRAESARDTRWGGGNASLLQVQVLPRQWMVGPRSDSRHCLGETPTGASSAVNCRQRREGEANRPQGQRPAGVSRGGPSWTEFVRLADQAVVAIAGWLRVEVRPPAVALKRSWPALKLYAVLAQEVGAPAGSELVAWRLLMTWPGKTLRGSVPAGWIDTTAGQR